MKKQKRHYSGNFDPPIFKFLEITKKKGLTIVFLVVSGRHCQKPVKIVFRLRDFLNWEVTLRFLSKRLDVPDSIH